MRNVACASWVELFARRPYVFFTGDLGYRALEPLQEAMGERFINAGVAEQNMVSVAAGVASRGISTWVYSIAPFCYARPFEQIRNDLCFHDLPVKLVGNGGGYAYGPMGASHHAIEDYGSLLGLQNMHAFVPAFGDDVSTIVNRLVDFPHPAYLRLGRCEKPEGFTLPEYSPWRRLTSGAGPVVVVVGPLVGSLWKAVQELDAAARSELWVLTELPMSAHDVPGELVESIGRKRRVLVVEEHVEQGGAGQAFAHHLLTHGISVDAFEHACARGYPSGNYGSQKFHRAECGLDAASLLQRIAALRSRP